MSNETKKKLDLIDIVNKMVSVVLVIVLTSMASSANRIMSAPDDIDKLERRTEKIEESTKKTDEKVDKICARLDSLIIENRINAERQKVVDSLIINKLR